MPMKHTAHITIDPPQVERVRKIAAAHDWRGHPPHQKQGNHNELLRHLADGRALFVPLPDPAERAALRHHIENPLAIGRDHATAVALQAILAALDLADELATEAAGENTAEKETE